MRKYRSFSRGGIALTTIGAVSICAFAASGCGGDKKEPDTVVDQETGDADSNIPEGENKQSSKAMGRYLEEDVLTPDDCGVIQSIQFLDDGSLKILYLNKSYQLRISQSKDDGQTWDTPMDYKEMFGISEDLEAGCGSISRDGAVCVKMLEADETGENYVPRYFYRSPDGEAKELSIDDQIGESAYVFRILFTEKGNILVQGTGNGIMEFDPADSSLVRSYEKGESVEVVGTAGSRLIVGVNDTLHYYDLETGKPLDDGDALTEQLGAKEGALQLTTTSSWPVLFTKGDEEGTVFCISHDGMYRYLFGGSVVEKIMDGSLNSCGSPDNDFTDFTRDRKGNFYLACSNYDAGESSGKILRYVYDKDISAVPDTELKVYSMKDNSFIHQAAAIFQKKYPDIYLSLETGMSGDDGVTMTDALKTLNTEIMAGKGPDILILDGIPADTYVEKGMLEDLSGVLSDIRLLDNIRDAYQNEDGAIYSLPVKFGIPMIQGDKKDLDQITDLKTLADVMEEHEGDYDKDHMTLSYAYSPELMLKGLADVNSYTWLEKDGGLNEEAIKEYLEQAKRIYDSGETSIEEFAKELEEYGMSSEEAFSGMAADFDSRTYGISASASGMLTGQFIVGTGGVFSIMDLATVDSVEKEKPSLESKLMNGQAQNCFIPVQTVGLSSKTSEKETAEKFIQFLFSEDGQKVGAESGFPVNEMVYNGMDYWKTAEEGKELMSMGSGNSMTGEMITLDIKMPGDDVLKRFQELGKTLTTPVMDNEIVLNAITDGGAPYLKGECSLEEAVNKIGQQIGLYLAE